MCSSSDTGRQADKQASKETDRQTERNSTVTLTLTFFQKDEVLWHSSSETGSQADREKQLSVISIDNYPEEHYFID